MDATKELRQKEFIKYLNIYDITYMERNKGCHIIANYKGKEINLYPTTGKYNIDKGEYKKGMENFFKDLGIWK